LKRATTSPRGSALVLFGVLVGAAACSTVSLGDPPADINVCRPSQIFFVEHVWPEYLTANIASKNCGDASCHGGTVGNAGQLRVIAPTSTPTPTYPLAGGSDWYALYLSAATEMNCNDVFGSKLFAFPAGLSPHGGGKLFDQGDSVGTAAFALLDAWVHPTP
jgi:hypothetical protein